MQKSQFPETWTNEYLFDVYPKKQEFTYISNKGKKNIEYV